MNREGVRRQENDGVSHVGDLTETARGSELDDRADGSSGERPARCRDVVGQASPIAVGTSPGRMQLTDAVPELAGPSRRPGQPVNARLGRRVVADAGKAMVAATEAM